MALSRRYSSNWPTGEATQVGMDFSDVIPPGTALLSGTLLIVKNTSPTQPQSDFVQSAVTTQQRQAWCHLSGGVADTDYQLRWSVTDNRSNIWSRTALMLCAETS